MKRFDLAIIGAGPAGYAAAMRALDFGKRVLLVERDRIGGAGIHNGALSSKTFWEVAMEIDRWRCHNREFGLPEAKVAWEDVVAQVDIAVRTRTEQLERHIVRCNDCDGGQGLAGGNAGAADEDGRGVAAANEDGRGEAAANEGGREVAAANEDGRRVTAGMRGEEDREEIVFVKGNGRLEGNHTVLVERDGQVSEYAADYVILATGSRPRRLPHVHIDEQVILSSDGIGNLRDFPESLVVLGAGVIGCEFATIFALLGRTRVFLIDKADRILPFEDEDVVKVVERNLEANGAVIHRNASLRRMEVKDGRVEYELEYKDGHSEVFHVEKALVSIGREPNTEGLGLETTDVQLTDRGHILELGKDTSTTAPNIFAVGDITADIALVNVGELEGRYAVERIFGKPDKELCYDNISTIMFLTPEVAGVGMNEIQARQAGLGYRVATWMYDCIPRAIARRQMDGFFKILVTDDAEMRVIGMRAIGQDASSAIQAVALLISMGKGIRELAEMVHPHPSMTEGVQECVRMLLGKSIFKPRAFQQLRLARWDGGRYREG